VLLFDASGNLLRHWGGPGQGYEWPENEHGIFVDDNDFVWLAGNGKKDGQLLKFTMDGKFVLQIGKQGQGNDSNATDRLGSPADVAVDVAAKEVFAADGYANRRVAVFDSETGAYKRHWGAYGNKPVDAKTPAYNPASPPSQQFGNPVHCIRLGKDGLIYVCDRTNNRMQVFAKDGTFVSEHIFEKATLGNGTVYDLVFSPDAAQKHIYMIDGMNGEVRVVDRATKDVLARFGRPGRPDSSPPCTTSRSTGKATSTPPRSIPGSGCRSSDGWTRRTKGRSARDLERLGHAVADRLGRLGHDLLRERREFLELRRRKFELLALMRERQLEQLARRLHLERAACEIERRVGVLARDLHQLHAIFGRAARRTGHRFLERFGRVLEHGRHLVVHVARARERLLEQIDDR
jgi:hypothetical protein